MSKDELKKHLDAIDAIEHPEVREAVLTRFLAKIDTAKIAQQHERNAK